MLEKQQREQLEEIETMNQWKAKVEEKKGGVEDSVGSSSMSVPNPTKKAIEASSGSYESDDFEDVSASGSGSKSKLNYWPGKDKFKKDADSVSAS
jgi:hypothetical protein